MGYLVFNQFTIWERHQRVLSYPPILELVLMGTHTSKQQLHSHLKSDARKSFAFFLWSTSIRPLSLSCPSLLFCLCFSHRCWHSEQRVSIFLCLSGPGQQVRSLMSVSCSPALLIPKTYPFHTFSFLRRVTLYREKYRLMQAFIDSNHYIDGNVVAMSAPGQ